MSDNKQTMDMMQPQQNDENNFSVLDPHQGKASMSDSDETGDCFDEDVDDTEDDDSSFDEDEDDCSDNPDTSSSDVSPEQANNGLFLSLEMVQMLRMSTSEGNLFSMLPQSTITKMTPQRRTSGGEPPAPSRMVFALQTKSPMASFPQHASCEAHIPKPKETLASILEAEGVVVTNRSYSELPDFFIKCCVSSHSLELMTAVRQNNLTEIQRQHRAGTNLQCANKFQESLIHAVARRGFPEMLMYLHQVAGVSLRVCCDGGRNILHDACWTGTPEFTLIKIILQDSPDLLYITDKRNLTPFDYIPKEAHESWNTWLHENKQLLRPRGFNS